MDTELNINIGDKFKIKSWDKVKDILNPMNDLAGTRGWNKSFFSQHENRYAEVSSIGVSIIYFKLPDGDNFIVESPVVNIVLHKISSANIILKDDLFKI